MNANSNTKDQLPTTWALAKIGELIGPAGVFIDGDWVETKDQDPNGDVRLIQLADVGDGTYRDRSSRFLTRAKAHELDCTFLKAGDVLIARMPDPLGRACIFPGDSKDTVTVVDVCIVRTGALGANHRWLVWAVNSPQFRSEVAALQSGSTRKRISRGNLATLFIPIPPLAEQARIAQEIDKQITRLEAGGVALRRAQANLQRYRAAVLKAAVEGRLVPTEAELARREGRSYEPASELLARLVVTQPLLAVSKKAQAGVPVPPKPKPKEPLVPDAPHLPKLPDGWARATVDQLTNLITSGSRGWAEYYSDSGPLFIRAQDIKTDRLELDSVAHVRLPSRVEGARTLISPSDILVTITGANVTKTAIVHGELGEAYVSQHVALVRPVNPSLSEYMYHWIICPSYGRRELERVAYGAGKPGLNLTNLRELLIAVPPLAEQFRIVAEVERRLSVIDELELQVEANLKRAERLRQAILKRAFEGKLVPQDPKDEPASMLLERIRNAKSTGKSACATGDTATPGCAGKRSKSKKAQARVPVSQK